MRRQRSQRSLPAIFLVCIVILVVSILLILPSPTLISPHSSPLESNIPTYITVSTEGTTFSTRSATLISESSLKNFSKDTSLFGSMFSFFSPVEKVFISPLDSKLVSAWVQNISATISKDPVLPTIEMKKETGKIEISSGSAGLNVDQNATLTTIMRMDLLATSSAQIVTQKTGTVLTDESIAITQRFAEKLIGKSMILRAPHYSKTVTSSEIVGLLDPVMGVSTSSLKKLADTINKQIGTDPVEPVLTLTGNQVTQFVAPKDGMQLNTEQFISTVTQKIDTLSTTKSVDPVDLTFIKSSPKNSIASVNNLGISGRIGLGVSQYAHSIPNRVKNVSLTTSKIHAKLVLPGEEFSFNKYLGEVSATTGFLPAYVIKEGQTVLGDGGGVCQVSSTLFRAILNAGLPVTERRGHSYRVSYYEENSKPGFDATVYSPHPDLRFKNDTDTPILINAVADPKTLSMYIELWGKSDGRIAQILNYKQWDAQPAPPAVYQDDPTLKPGKLKQIDWAAPGLKTSFDYEVTYPDGSIKSKNFATNYIPWRAVYLRGI